MRALDLFCCAGGASTGIHQAGFKVTGVDIDPQKHYPYEFIQCDIKELDPDFLNEFDYIWASPPCQCFTSATALPRSKGKTYPDLIEFTRNLLKNSGKLYTIENVPRAPLIDPIMLCGTMFGLELYRHRHFESNFFVDQPFHIRHTKRCVKLGYKPKPGEIIQMAGHFSGIQIAREVTGFHWMNQYELAQCIPSNYSCYIAQFARKILQEGKP